MLLPKVVSLSKRKSAAEFVWNSNRALKVLPIRENAYYFIVLVEVVLLMVSFFFFDFLCFLPFMVSFIESFDVSFMVSLEVFWANTAVPDNNPRPSDAIINFFICL